MRAATSIVIAIGLLGWSASALASQEPTVEGVIGEVRIVERGAQPWRLLRYDWEAGSTESARTDYRMSMSIVQAGEETRMTMPGSMEFETTITDVRPDGTARFELVYTAFEVSVSEMTLDGQPLDDRMLEVATSDLRTRSRQLVGSTGWEVYDSRGVLLDWGIDMPEAFPEDMQAQVEEMSAAPTVLPEEPVGVGAVWESIGSFSESGIELGVVEVNELVALDGDTLQLDVRMELDASGGIALEQLGSRSEGTVESLSLRGGGPVLVDLRRVFAESIMDLHIHMEMSAEDGEDDKPATTVDADLELAVTPGR